MRRGVVDPLKAPIAFTSGRAIEEALVGLSLVLIGTAQVSAMYWALSGQELRKGWSPDVQAPR